MLIKSKPTKVERSNVQKDPQEVSTSIINDFTFPDAFLNFSDDGSKLNRESMLLNDLDTLPAKFLGFSTATETFPSNWSSTLATKEQTENQIQESPLKSDQTVRNSKVLPNLGNYEQGETSGDVDLNDALHKCLLHVKDTKLVVHASKGEENKH